jgi:hypothetical protein
VKHHGMTPGFKNRRVECPVCHHEIGSNNIHRHLMTTHDLKTREARRVLASGTSLNGNSTQATAATHEGQEETGATADYSNDISYLWGKVETLIEHYCDSSGVPRAIATSGLAGILRSKEGRQVLGAQHRLSQLRRNTA